MRIAFHALGSAFVFALSCAAVFAANSPPSLTSPPTLDAIYLVADGTTVHTVSMTVSDPDGYNDIRDMRTMFDYVRSAGDHSKPRGYLAWGAADGDLTRYGGVWVIADASGGGRWGYYSNDFGSTTYMSPTGCTVTVSGAATAGTGTRTVTWSFIAKPAWAGNPIINTADIFFADYAVNVGWQEGIPEFDVMAMPCAQRAAAPQAPVVTTTSAIDAVSIAINPADSDTDLFAIKVSPPISSMSFLQADGSVAGFPAWRTKADWGTTQLHGLVSSTTYAFAVRAIAAGNGSCGSAWGPTASGTTGILDQTIDYTRAGVAFNKGVTGVTAIPESWGTRAVADNLAVSYNASNRWGGDGYDWKKRNAPFTASTRTTLRELRDLRDRNSFAVNNLNTRGIGTGNGSTWVYTDQTPQAVATLAADWVYYCNKLLPSKRKGDTLTAQEQALIDSLNWGTEDKLLNPGEAATPKVVYWEVGNEPEGPYPDPALSASDYALRYKTITQAMLAVDPTIKVGPSVMGSNNNAWLDAVFADPANHVDFVCYHPYGNLWYITQSTGGLLSAPDLMNGLMQLRQAQLDRHQGVIDRLAANNRPTNTPIMCTEFNPSSWQGTWYFGLSQSVAHALGLADTVLTFGEQGFLAAHYYEQPNYPSPANGRQAPGFKVLKALQSYQPAWTIHSCFDGPLHLYTTLDASKTQLIVWAVNMSQSDDKPVRLHLAGPVRAAAVTERKLADTRGNTSLVTRNDAKDTVDYVDWIVTDHTGQIDSTDFTWTFGHATLTMLVLDLRHLSRIDYDQDDDVDQSDFGYLQTCLSGMFHPYGPGCADADLDGNNYVEEADISLFLGCMHGSGVSVPEDCPN